MSEELLKKLARYEAKHGGQRVLKLGSGIHGIVYSMRSQRKGGRQAVKVLSESAPFEREGAVYARLAEHGVTEICGHQVPTLLRVDEELLVIEMTLVARPFVLDFASAYLDWPPKFSPEVLADQDEDIRERFGARYEAVRRILAELEEMGIFQTDVNPGNMGFRVG